MELAASGLCGDSMYLLYAEYGVRDRAIQKRQHVEKETRKQLFRNYF